jgi:hypothetical protein
MECAMSNGKAKRWIQDPLALACLVSMLVHVGAYFAYNAGKHLHWAGQEKLLSLLVPKPSARKLPLLDLYRNLLARPLPPPQLQPQPKPKPEMPTIFVTVDPLLAVAEPPKNARYYSDKNTLAANPEVKKPSEDPNIDGKQVHVPQTMDIPRTVVAPPEPLRAPPKPVEPKPSEPEPETRPPETKRKPPQPRQEELKPKPKPVDAPGDLAMAKPSETPQKTESQADSKKGQDDRLQEAREEVKPSRPRTLEEARARLVPKNQIAGQKMAQEGGVKRYNIQSSLNVRASPFGSYDAVIIAAIQDRWFGLLDERKYSGDVRGKVVIDFKLYSDGSVREIRESENTASPLWGLICQRAISDPAPFRPWPAEMKQFYGHNFREVRFTFFYD